MSVAHVPPGWDFDEYLEFEMASRSRHELHDGYLVLMTGGSLAHSQIATNLSALITPAARAKGCRSYVADARLRVGDDSFYPDVMVSCAELGDDRFETQPCLVVEVLSPSSHRRDQHHKLSRYTSIASLGQYLIMHGDEPVIQVYERGDDASWQRRIVAESDSLDVACVDVTITVDELYDGVT